MVDTSKWENDGHWNSGDLFQTKPYLEFNLEKPPKPKQFFLTILKSNRRYRTQKLKFLKLYHRFFHSNNTVYESTVPHQPHVVSNKPPNLPTSPVPPPHRPSSLHHATTAVGDGRRCRNRRRIHLVLVAAAGQFGGLHGTGQATTSELPQVHVL